MKRGTGLSQGRKVLARAAVERRKASASAKSGARHEPAQRQRCDSAEWSLTTRLSALRLPLGEARFVKPLAKLGAQTKSAARERECLFTSPRARGEVAIASVREAIRVRGPIRDSERTQSSASVTDDDLHSGSSNVPSSRPSPRAAGRRSRGKATQNGPETGRNAAAIGVQTVAACFRVAAGTRVQIHEGWSAMISGPSSLRANGPARSRAVRCQAPRSNPGRLATAETLFWIASTYALRAPADSKPPEAHGASVGGSSLSLLAMTAVPANRPNLIPF